MLFNRGNPNGITFIFFVNFKIYKYHHIFLSKHNLHRPIINHFRKLKSNKDIDKLNIQRSEIPALTHIDYSARVQTVDKDTNSIYLH